MTAPTPEEVTAALAILRRIPEINEHATLGAIERTNTPLRWMARELNEIWSENGLPVWPGNIAAELETVAARHGLRIAADLGEPIGYAIVENDNTEVASYRVYSRADLEEARANAAKRRGGVVVALLPEGGQA
ncbi:hypothetical protein [Nocardia sp. MW-W600-9]